jgi:Spy/CpxP family protein refolding chaperone
MHSRMMSLSRARHEDSGACGCGPRVAFFPMSGTHRHFSDPGGPGFGGGSFGVRRPLRFLSWKLGLRDEQVAELAAIINDLKTERAQNEVDDRRALSLLADAVAGESLNEASVQEAAKLRTESTQRLQAQVTKAVTKMHALLDADQRGRLAYLIRSGALVM